jgi:hypothetical protein
MFDCRRLLFRRSPLFLAAPAALLVACLSAGLAQAAGHPDGRNCTVADRGSSIWFGFFKGPRTVFAPLSGSNKAPSVARWRCFDTEAECQAWSAEMAKRSANALHETFCRMGG